MIVIDSIETAQREIKFFFPEFDVGSTLNYQSIPFEKFLFDEATLEHRKNI